MNKIHPKLKLLVAESRRWVGVTERGGDNKGQLIEMWQKAVDNKAVGEAWCMGFVQANIAWVDRVAAELGYEIGPSQLFKSEHCLTVWNKTPVTCRSFTPVPGYVAIWQHGDTTAGHAGIVSGLNLRTRQFTCIEGNTGPGDGVIREGDGVYEKTRSMDGAGKMKLLGFLVPWADNS
jgi:hypothetical protein